MNTKQETGVVTLDEEDSNTEPMPTFDDDDLDESDPNLLEELQDIIQGMQHQKEINAKDSHCLSTAPQSPHHSPLQKRKETSSHHRSDNSTTLLSEPSDMSDIEKDPELLAALASLTLSTLTPSSTTGTASTVIKSPGMTVPNPISANSTQLAALQDQQSQYKKHALQAKRAGDMTLARESLSIAKMLQQPINLIKAGGSLPASFVMPPILVLDPGHLPVADTTKPTSTSSARPPVDVSSSLSSKITATTTLPTPVPFAGKKATPKVSVTGTTPTTGVLISPIAGAVDLSADSSDHIIQSIQAQIITCSQIAAQYYKGNQKADALLLHKLKRSFAEFLSAGASWTRPLSYVTITYDKEISYADIVMEEIELSIVKAYELGNREVPPSEVEAVVTYDVTPFSTASNGVALGEVFVGRKSPNPDIKFTAKIPITRNKALLRAIERKRAVFDLYHQPPKSFLSFVGLGGRRVPLGRASMKLDGLLTACEVVQVLPLVDMSNSRKEVGGRVEVHVRVRTPFAKAESMRVSERWIMVTSSDMSSGVGNVPESAVSISGEVVEKMDDLPITAAHLPSQPLQTADDVQKTEAKTALPHTQDGVDEQLLVLRPAFDDPETIASNAVLEAEHADLVTRLSYSRSDDRHGKQEVEELTLLKGAYEGRMNYLMVMVQLGKLTIPDYMAQVRGYMDVLKTQALTFRRLGDTVYAKRALVRIKRIEGELATF